MTVVNLAKLDEFETAVKYTKFLVVHFYADWVEQCQLMNKVLDEMATQTEFQHIQFAKLHAEKVPEVSLRYRISAVPTFILLSSGKEYGRVEGANPNDLTNKVKSMAGGASMSSTLEDSKPIQSKIDLNAKLKSLINAAPIMLFMKGKPTEPRCGFSRQIIDILGTFNAKYETFDILTDNDVRQGLKKYSDWPTYPQLYINGELIGGLDIVKEMVSTGELKDKLKVLKPVTNNERFKELINKANIMVFMKGNKQNPKCGFSRQMMDLLNEIGTNFETFDILEDEEIRQGLKVYSNWPTYPQLYIKGELIGGLDIAKELNASGELKNMLSS